MSASAWTAGDLSQITRFPTQALGRELKVWSRVNHPNVVPLIGFHLSPTVDAAWLLSPWHLGTLGAQSK